MIRYIKEKGDDNGYNFTEKNHIYKKSMSNDKIRIGHVVWFPTHILKFIEVPYSSNIFEHIIFVDDLNLLNMYKRNIIIQK